MDISKRLRHGRGLILSNNTGVFEKNVSDEVMRETFDFLDKRELESRLDDKHKDSSLNLEKKGNNNNNTCIEWGTGDYGEMIKKEADEGSAENKIGKWYTFLDDLYYKLSSHAQQILRERYNVADLDDWDQIGKPQGIYVTTETFGKFLNKIQKFSVAEYETIRKLSTITDSMIEELNQVLSSTLKHIPIIECSEPDIIVKGNFISLKETMENILSNTYTNNGCNNFEDQVKKGKYNLFKIFALGKVFIDTDLLFSGKRMSVAIIAPKWEVIGSRIIELNGADGIPHALKKAKDGPYPGNKGSNGAPGNPGVSGETFFGIAAAIGGMGKLKVSSKGGKGGPGQDGGNGKSGMPGKDAVLPSGKENVCERGKFMNFKCELLKKKSWYDYSSDYSITTYKIHGVPAGRGGNGGSGGKGGNGGKAGNIQIIDFGGHSDIQELSAEGGKGTNGKGGFGGSAGNIVDDIIADFKTDKNRLCAWGCHKKWWEKKEKKRHWIIGSGNKGFDGRNVVGIKDPVPAKGISRLPNLINEYKIFLRENIHRPFQQCTLRKFLDHLDKNKDVRRLYDILALSDEFLDLEEQFLKLNDLMDVSPFYKSLLERIDAFSKDQIDISNSNDVKIVLNYLYTATFGKIVGLKENSEQTLIIDMRRYLSMVADDINTLKNLQASNNKVDIINKYKDIYKNGFEEKINEANLLIEGQIKPEINNTYSKIDGQVKALITETINEQKKAEKDLKKLEEKEKELGNAMALKGLFNCFKIIGGLVSFLGPIGTVAGTVITGATTVGETLALSEKEKTLSLPDPVAKDLKTLKDQIVSMRKHKTDYLEKLLKNLSQEIEKNPDTLGDMASKVEDIKGKLEKVSKKELDFKVVGELQAELEKDIENKGVDLKKNPRDKKNLDAVNAIEKVTKIVELGSLFSKMYGDMEKDKEKMDAITKSMENMQDKIKMLKEYEENIYQTMAPMLQEMEEHMDDISAKLGKKSHVALDVTKWKVQSTLKDIKFQMQKLTKGHNIEDELSHTIENLNEVMTTLINVYDRIQDYQDQQNLANYIADISSVESSSINIWDQELVNIVNRLEFAIRGNIVLDQYKKAIDGLKQWVFPFADKYIDESMLPSHLQLQENIENLVQDATRRIDKIRLKLVKYDTCIMNGYQSFVCEEFSSQYVSTHPFFVFKNEIYRSSISRLLSGEEVILKAEVEKSVPYKDAIKFSEIEFYWKVKNGTSQFQLNEILKGFDIRATHLGNSYYRYDNNISLITSNSLTLAFSYERQKDGRPVRENEVYRRLKSGDLLLSPYTLWKIQLIKRTDEYSFKDLIVYENETDLELSGLGSYVDTVEQKLVPNNIKRFKREFSESTGSGLKGCRRCVYRRSARSVKGIKLDSVFATNDASKVMSSPINLICNFIKTYFVSNILRSVFPNLYDEDNTWIKSDSSEFSDGCSETRDKGPILDFIPTVSAADANSYKNYFIKERIGKMSSVFNVNFNGKNRCFNPSLLIDQNDESNNTSIQYYDLNCSLLLADYVTRNITGNRYKSWVGEYLLSPRQIMFEKICKGGVRNESDVNEMLERLLAEEEGERSSSLFSKLHSYIKSILGVFGFAGNTGTEQYILDIRHLYA